MNGDKGNSYQASLGKDRRMSRGRGEEILEACRRTRDESKKEEKRDTNLVLRDGFGP